MDIMKICMWSFGGNKVKFDRQKNYGLLNIVIFGSFYMIGYRPILKQFSMDRFQTLHTTGKHIEVLHLEFR